MLRWSILASALWMAVACGGSSKQETGGDGSAGDGAGGGTAGSTGGGTAGSAAGGTAGSAAGGTAGGAAGSAAGGTAGSGGGDVPICDGLPRDGGACSPNGQKCQSAGSPCGSIHTCQAGAWASQTVCPPTQMCPQDMPEQGAACTVENPVVGLDCRYDSGCGNVAATCSDARWELEANPVTECGALCDDVCQRLSECGIAWARDCAARCKVAYLCPGESAGQDAAICTSEQARLADLDCVELCGAVTDGADAAAFGVDCDFMPP